MKSENATQRIIQLAFVVIIGGGWYWITATGNISPLFLPKPEAVWNAFNRLLTIGQFWPAVFVTLKTIAQAYGIAIIAGITAGYLVTRSKFLSDAIEPIIAGLFTIPITLFFPMFILFFGIGAGSKIAYGAVYGFFPIALNTIAGLNNVDERYLRAAQSMGASRVDTFRYVLLPYAFPVILTGMRIGFFICFASVLGGETLSSVAGVGRNIALAAELMEPARMYAWIAFVIFTAITLNMLVTALENRAARSEGRR
jgi:ABC-type nitrate/sulfonate/bicarbonate transport system permease component